MSTLSFSITKNNFFNVATNGSGDYKFTGADFPLPNNIGTTGTLADLINMVGNNITVSYDVHAVGNVSGHLCRCTYTLSVNASMYDGTRVQNIELANTPHESNDGRHIDTGWIGLGYSGPSLIYELASSQSKSGDGCGCAFESYGGWKDIIISIRANVIVYAVQYCTASGQQNIHNDFCYHFMSDYITKNGSTQEIDTYMKNYCSTKYPTQGLDIFNDPNNFDAKDYNICACNMNQSYYNTFLQSVESRFQNLDIGNLRANCLLPACVLSNFKSSNLDKCLAVPPCLEIVEINNSSIVGPVTVNQNAQCQQMFIPGSKPGPPGPSPGPSPASVGRPGWEYIIILLIIVIVILALIGTSVYYFE